MPRAARPWFRFYVETMSDRKLRRLPLDQRWIWCAVLSAARQSPIPGHLMVSEREPLEDDELADIAGAPVKVVRAALPRFEASGMIHRHPESGCWVVTNFAVRQFESDNVTERTRKHRSREQGKERSNGVPGNAPEQSRAETEQIPSSSSVTPPRCDPPLDDDGELYAEANRRADAMTRAGRTITDRPAYVAQIVNTLRLERWRPDMTPGACRFGDCDGGWIPTATGERPCPHCLPWLVPITEPTPHEVYR